MQKKSNELSIKFFRWIINPIREQGGYILHNRVSGQLAVTRALGDLSLKKEVVIIWILY